MHRNLQSALAYGFWVTLDCPVLLTPDQLSVVKDAMRKMKIDSKEDDNG